MGVVERLPVQQEVPELERLSAEALKNLYDIASSIANDDGIIELEVVAVEEPECHGPR